MLIPVENRKPTKRRTSCLLKLLLIPIIALSTSGAGAAIPTVEITYSKSLDWVCSQVRGPDVEEAWEAELENLLPRYQQQWQTIGPRLLETTSSMTGKFFPESDITAHLTLCNVPSNAFFSIVVNMRHALSSYTADPVPLDYKISVLFHEILHQFLNAHRPDSSDLLTAHQDEDYRVLDHLHLLALEKAVYLQLGLDSELDNIIEVDGRLPSDAYKKAWSIVNKTPDEYRKYVAEIKGG